jgi:hypothetical protein
MKISNKIEKLLKGPANRSIIDDISEICLMLSTAKEGTIFIPLYAWEAVGLGENADPGNNYVGNKEYLYFQNCQKCASEFQKNNFDEAKTFLNKAKWEFNEWSLAHYLLGLIFIQEQKNKSALDEFELACSFEPFNHQPMAIMRELARYLVLNY